MDIISRECWGAEAPNFTGNQEGRYDALTNPGGYALYSELRPGESLASVLDTITIHHAGDRIGKFNPIPSMKDIQSEQLASGKFADIAYHYGIDASGNIYEGRPLDVRGAHADEKNTGNVGILFLRDFEPGPWYDFDSTDDTDPSDEAIKAAETLVKSLDINYGISSVKGHSDAIGGGTECPGSLLQPFVSRLNAIVEPSFISGQFA
jgi:hypothetical protein